MKQIVVHCDKSLTKVALIEDRLLIEYYAERPAEKQWVGNITKGRVVNVLPGMQAAFVDIGQGKNAFLYIDDLLPAHSDKQPQVKPSISELISEGQHILVQVIREPFGTKGARVTTHISIPGRWIVYMPDADYVGVSRKIEHEEERNRLKLIGEDIRLPEEGLIIRTVAMGESEKALQQDVDFLRSLWANIRERETVSEAPALLYHDLELIPRLMRDIFTDQVDEMIIDDAEKGLDAIRFLQGFSSSFASRVKIYTDALPVYQAYGIQEQLEQVFSRKIRLKSGGYIVLDQTEALAVIDVNTGKFIGDVNLEQTVFQTNMEAAVQAARLIRLRDIGGMIIIDFIDMEMDEHKARTVEILEEIMKRDRTKSLVVGWTRLGLLEITRKKVRDNMDTLFYETCAQCNGSGKLYTRMHPLF